MTLQAQRDAYKQFFLKTEAGQEFIKSAMSVVDRNINHAMNENDLDHLSRAKGNREIIDLIDNVIKTEVKPKG